MSSTATQIADRVDSLIDDATHATDDALRRSQRIARKALEQISDQTAHARDTTRGYIQHDPLTAVLVAAVAGAALVLLGSLLTRDSSR